MRINLNWTPTLAACPECGHEQNFSERAACRACDYHAGSDMSEEWTEFVEKLDAELPDGLEITFAHESEGDGYWLDMHVSLRRGEGADEVTLRTWIAANGTVEEGEIRAALLGCNNPIDEEMTEFGIERLIEEMREESSPEWVTGESYRAWQEEIENAEAALAAIRAGKPVWRGQDEDGNFWWY